MCSTAPNPQHYSECICEQCEKHQTGFFAQRNFLAGDDDARLRRHARLEQLVGVGHRERELIHVLSVGRWRKLLDTSSDLPDVIDSAGELRLLLQPGAVVVYALEHEEESVHE